MANDDGGLADVLAAFDRVIAASREAAMTSLIGGANEVAALQRHLAPKDTGALADSIHVSMPGEATPAFSQPGGSRVAGPNEVIVTVGDHVVRYPHMVEFGTSKMEAEPFFWPPYRYLAPKIKRRVATRYKRAVRKAWSKWGGQ
ncbi:MAG: HK97-gp10 family putative phage morphogenesis protein [Mesorhizobium sp.]